MIFEQALMHLPELLAGSGYARQEYEGGIVSAYSMAILQALNSRNVANPISLLRAERLYTPRKDAWKGANGKRRYLRADLELDQYPMKVGNHRIAQYGWRHSNWLEAKFFRAFNKQTRAPKKNTNQAAHTGHLLADLIRLLALCPHGITKSAAQTSSPTTYIGRYLLHVYSNKVEDHLSLKMNSGGQRVERGWLKAITSDGGGSVDRFALGTDTAGVLSQVGNALKDIEIEFSCTNLVIRPLIEAATPFSYTCVLTRFDSYALYIPNGGYLKQNQNGVVTSDLSDARRRHAKIASTVGASINLKDDVESELPEVPSIPDANYEPDE